MSRTLYIFRPEPGLRVTLETARAQGIDAEGCPLFEVKPVSWDVPDRDEYDALLVGSSNVFRHGGSGLDRLAGLPVYAVGEATAEGAKEKGFIVAQVGKGGLQALVDKIGGREIDFLRLAGEAMVELDPPEGIAIDTRIVYRTKPLDLSEAIATKIQGAGGVAALHSGEAARRLRSECERLGIDRGKIAIAALGPRIAELSGDGWQDVRTSNQPLDAELLALAQRMCQD